MYIVDNAVDNRKQPHGFCTGNNVNGMKSAGVIGVASVMVDSAIEGNVQEQSSGISIDADYKDLECSACHCPLRSYRLKYFGDVRGNTINGEYDYENAWSQVGGISLTYGGGAGLVECAPDPECRCNYPTRFPALPIVPAYGVSVSRNVVTRADGRNGGAISFFSGFGEPGSALYLNTLVYQNRIADQSPAPWINTRYEQCAAAPSHVPSGLPPHRGIGIKLGLGAWYSICDQNLFDASVTVPYSDDGEGNIY